MIKRRQFTIDAKGMHYRKLNAIIKDIFEASLEKINPEALPDVHNNSYAVNKGYEIIKIKNVMGQRYIGDGIRGDLKIKIYGIPGNDMAAFMDGPEIEVYGNAQDGCANTMNSGKIIIHGSCGDIAGYSMRGGELYIKDSVGWRSGIHMKSYMEKLPVIVIGGRAGNFLGEYMAGGLIIVLGIDKLNARDKDLATLEEGSHKNATRTSYYFEKFYSTYENSIVGDFAGTGMHGGSIFIRGDIDEDKTGKEVKKIKLEQKDKILLETYVKNYCKYFNADYNKIVSK
ncbi:MAG: hypothetical protein JW997_07750, partial [Actinobacteria bacterium]|nr:hypothetical protein [Actinomycetota bacterium]